MATQDQSIKIIGNESNSFTEIEAGPNTQTEQHTTAEKVEASEQLAADAQNEAADRSTEEITTNDGSLIETLDTALHNKPGVAEGLNISGSNRADYYESQSYGKTDAEEELDALNNDPS